MCHFFSHPKAVTRRYEDFMVTNFFDLALVFFFSQKNAELDGKRWSVKLKVYPDTLLH